MASADDCKRDSLGNMPGFLPELQAKQLGLFKQFDEFARQNGITYYALGGTLLGAIRHKGFIPWDDDIDLGLPRPDYERFLAMVERGEVPFRVRSFQTNDDFFERFSQMVDDSIQVTRTDRTVPEVTGAWVDFFPLDGIPGPYPLRWAWSRLVTLFIGVHRLSVIDINGFGKAKVGKSRLFTTIANINEAIHIGKLINKRKALIRLDKVARVFPYEKSKWVNHSMSSRMPYIFPKEWYEPGVWYDFEDTKVFGPRNYDAILTQLYGDYMELPPESERGRHFEAVESEDS